jgi:hypothetical protein
LHQFSRQREGMPMNSKLSLALSEFSKGRWATSRRTNRLFIQTN